MFPFGYRLEYIEIESTLNSMYARYHS